jgi:hypothetical protein
MAQACYPVVEEDTASESSFCSRGGRMFKRSPMERFDADHLAEGYWCNHDITSTIYLETTNGKRFAVLYLFQFGNRSLPTRYYSSLPHLKKVLPE